MNGEWKQLAYKIAGEWMITCYSTKYGNSMQFIGFDPSPLRYTLLFFSGKDGTLFSNKAYSEHLGSLPLDSTLSDGSAPLIKSQHGFVCQLSMMLQRGSKQA